MILVRKGDKIAGNYQAVNITNETLTLRFLEDGREIAIPLVENRPLGTPVR